MADMRLEEGLGMQTRAQSSLEAFVDLLFSMLMNVGGQRLLYGTVATVGRITFFSSIFLAAVFLRRLGTRRVFEALTPAGTRQSRLHSALEVVSDTVLGFGIAVVLQLLIYGEAATVWRAGGLTFGLYVVAIIRRYVLRRIFDAVAARTVTRRNALAAEGLPRAAQHGDTPGHDQYGEGPPAPWV
jgi:hypothetical protein